MDEGLVVIPSRAADWRELDSIPLELARARVVQGRVFEKHILNKGVLYHPKTGAPITVDDEFVRRMQANFADGVCDIVQVPLANEKNEHSERASDNIGEVVGIMDRGEKIYAVIDARDADAAAKLGKTYLGASAFLSTNYTDTRDNTKKGPTLLHVAVTNRPYVTGLEDYRELPAYKVAASRSDNTEELVVLAPPEETPTMPELTKDELLAALRDKHGVDVGALEMALSQSQGQLQQAAAQLATRPTPEQVAALTASLPSFVQPPAADPDAISLSDITGAIVELSRHNSALSGEVTSLKTKAAETEVDKLVHDGFILPKQRDFAVRLFLSNRDEFDTFVPDAVVVPLNQQSGVLTPRDEAEQAAQESEITRLTKLYTDEIAPGSRPNGRRRAG